MNITYIIGNGFDINLGLKTSYKDFYKYYRNTESSDDRVRKLKSDIGHNSDLWSDLEERLGALTNEFNSVSSFELIYEDIQSELSKYIENEQNRFKITDNTAVRTKIINDLAMPNKYLARADRDIISSYIRNKGNSGEQNNSINIITLNYTRCLELILGDYSKPLTKTPSGYNRKLEKIFHIHGYYDNNMVLGVNDSTQIINNDLQKDQSVNEMLVKPTCNKVLKHLIDTDCLNTINKSDLIYIFGTSLGPTDKIWWKRVIDRLVKSEARLIIFYKDDGISNRNQQYKVARKEREVIERFLSMATLTEDQKKKVRSQIIFGCNTQIFGDAKLTLKVPKGPLVSILNAAV